MTLEVFLVGVEAGILILLLKVGLDQSPLILVLLLKVGLDQGI